MSRRLRPEHLAFEAGPERIRLAADLSESLGGSTLIYGQVQPAAETMVLQVPGRRVLGKGEAFAAGFEASNAYVFDKDGVAF